MSKALCGHDILIDSRNIQEESLLTNSQHHAAARYAMVEVYRVECKPLPDAVRACHNSVPLFRGAKHKRQCIISSRHLLSSSFVAHKCRSLEGTRRTAGLFDWIERILRDCSHLSVSADSTLHYEISW